MRSLLKELAGRPDAIGTIFVIGAGNGAELPGLRELNGERVILAEPNPDLADMLTRRIDAARGEEVWRLAITPAPVADVVLHVLSSPGFSSLRQATGLLEHFPNIVETAKERVPARPFAEAIESLALGEDADHLLVLDAPGQAADLIEAVPVEALQSFSRIIIRCGVDPLYSGERAFDEVAAVLRDVGFEARCEDPEAIYPTTAFLFERDDARVERLRNESRLADLSAERDALAELAERRAREIERLERGRDNAAALAQKYKSALDESRVGTAQLEAASSRAEEQAALANRYKAELDEALKSAAEARKLADDRQAVNQKANADRNATLAQLEQTRAELEQARADLDAGGRSAAEVQKLAADRHAVIQKLTAERDAARTQLEQALAQHQSMEARIAALAEELAEARRTSSLSVRLQTLREADLKDLQGRYRALMAKHEGQRDLLVKLSDRLTIASDYFHRLTLAEQVPRTPVEGDAPRAKVIKPGRPARKRTREQ